MSEDAEDAIGDVPRPEDVDRISSQAGLRVPVDLRDKLLGDLSAILEYVRRLEEVDASGAEPAGPPDLSERPGARGDRPEEGLSAEEALRGAPGSHRGYFRVPKVV